MLLQGLTKLGIDNDLGVKDPMVDCFLNNIMRADDQEISYFYDLLGCALSDVPPLADYEGLMVFLCAEREHLSSLFSFLAEEDDIAALKQRVTAARELLAFAPASGEPPLAFTASALTIERPKVAPYGYAEEKSNLRLLTEQMLMEADWAMRAGPRLTAVRLYRATLETSMVAATANIPYDGTSCGAAAVWGLVVASHRGILTGLFAQCLALWNGSLAALRIPADSSLRACTARAHALISLAADQRLMDHCGLGSDLKAIPKSHATLVRYYIAAGKAAMGTRNWKWIASEIPQVSHRNPHIEFFYRALANTYVMRGEPSECPEILMQAIRYNGGRCFPVAEYRDVLPYLNGEEWRLFRQMLSRLPATVPATPDSVKLLHEIRAEILHRYIVTEATMRELQKAGPSLRSVEHVDSEVINTWPHPVYVKTYLEMALSMGMTNRAFACTWSALQAGSKRYEWSLYSHAATQLARLANDCETDSLRKAMGPRHEWSSREAIIEDLRTRIYMSTSSPKHNQQKSSHEH
jgi:hypothetical protein